MLTKKYYYFSQVLRMFCFNCHHFLFSRANVEIYIAQLRALNLGLDFVLDDLQEYANELTHVNAQFDWNSLEGQTYLRGRLNDKINFEYTQLKSNKKKKGGASQEDEAEAASSSSSQPSTSRASAVKTETVREEIPVATLEGVEILNSKNVIERKQHLFKDFIGGKLVKPGKVCHSCNSRKAGMNVINRSLIVLSAAKAAMSVAKFNKENGSNDDEESNEAKNINIEMKGKSYLTPSQAREHLRRLWSHEQDTLVRIFPFINLDVAEAEDLTTVAGCPLDVFFWETIIVSPNRFRPLRFLNGRSFEHYRTSALAELMIVAKSLEYALSTAKKNSNNNSGNGGNGGESIARFHASWQRLQILANRLYDARLDNLPDNKAIGVKQTLEKKEGLLRKNMMGKRVNYAARSVISPDPYIMVDEIGVPVVFATRLSYPAPVTLWNVHQLQQAVLNGPLVWPGALSVTYEDGYTVRLSPESADQRREVAGTLHAPSLAQGESFSVFFGLVS